MSIPQQQHMVEEQHCRLQQKEGILQWLSGCCKRRPMSIPQQQHMVEEQHCRLQQKAVVERLLQVTQEFLAITNDNWGFTTRYIQSDGERGLGEAWKDLIRKRGIAFNPSPPRT